MKLGGSFNSDGLSLLDQVEKAIEYGFEALQVFLTDKSLMPSTKECFKDGERIKYLLAMSGLKVYVHAPLMINPVHSAEGKRKMAAITLKKHMRISYHLGFDGVVVHPGSSTGDWGSLLKDTLGRVFDGTYYGNVVLLLENACGQGNTIASLDNLVSFVSKENNKNLAICVDTAHAWAFGHDVLSREFKDFMLENKSIIRLVHFNNPDKIVALGSHKDRHRAGFDNGRLTRDEFFRLAVQVKEFPCVMETFYVDELSTFLKLKNYVSSIEKGEYYGNSFNGNSGK